MSSDLLLKPLAAAFGIPLRTLIFAPALPPILIAKRSIAMPDAHETDHDTHHASRHHTSHHHADPSPHPHPCWPPRRRSNRPQPPGQPAHQTDTSPTMAAVTEITPHNFTDGHIPLRHARRRAPAFLFLDASPPELPHHHPGQRLSANLGLFAGFLPNPAASDILPEAHTPFRATGLTLTTAALGTLFMWGVIGLTD
ncbi:hypothetical protein ACIBI9_44330 [Nonomuraea sp. NPDC050451]|uniref:hypothetical protein n=1 Tax=Nonomuraea sp. NPDC050451 TaxID=3364364 RepID=UPI0037924001